MPQVFDNSTGETIVRSDFQTPANAVGTSLPRTIVQVDIFTDPAQVPDQIDFVLDERFREQALQSLLARSDIGVAGVPTRDLANFIPVDLKSSTPVFITALMKSKLYSPEAVDKVISRTFTEFV